MTKPFMIVLPPKHLVKAIEQTHENENHSTLPVAGRFERSLAMAPRDG